jgi:hypothetical protein
LVTRIEPFYLKLSHAEPLIKTNRGLDQASAIFGYSFLKAVLVRPLVALESPYLPVAGLIRVRKTGRRIGFLTWNACKRLIWFSSKKMHCHINFLRGNSKREQEFWRNEMADIKIWARK